MFDRINAAVNTGHSRRLWPVFALLIAVVALPTGVVFWFVNQAMQNEELAMRQRLTDLYRSQLQTAAERIQKGWHDKVDLVSNTVGRNPGPEAFAALVRAGQVDSVLIYRKGAVIYPKPSAFPRIMAEPQTPAWLEARNLEYAKNSPKAAAEVYSRISRQAGSAQEEALALMAQARCLNKDRNRSETIRVLVDVLGKNRYRHAVDAQGRSISLNALLFALQLMKESSDPSFQRNARILADDLNDYRDFSIPSSQRRFLMEQLRLLWPDCPVFPTFAAETLAAGFEKIPADSLKSGQMQPTPIEKIWAYPSADKSWIALFRQRHLIDWINSAGAAHEIIGGIRLSILQPGNADSPYLSEKIGDEFPSWKAGLSLDAEDPFQSAARQKIIVYVWTGIMMTAGIVLLSILLAAHLRRQMRLTNLRNDLIATVSHELKTPLASMRLLIDTLRDGRYRDTQLVQEYLQMISKENSRLSGLIEGFLAFSRMERNKAKFKREMLQSREIVDAALEAVGNRLQGPDCRLVLDLAPKLPPVVGDRDALVTVFVNLLDNALKYTGESKEIRLRGFAANGSVHFEIQDNGIGFPQSAGKRIFERFYQVDQTLSRRTSGCGLGLSIVQFIVTAHKGSITAESEPGKGSTFTVQLPSAG
jgi:signal transduction histidine kinase